MDNILVPIGGYSVSGYYWLLYSNTLVVILSVAINGYFIYNY